MRKKYEKPVMEISLYQVNEAFAECTVSVNVGPSTVTSTTTCSDYTSHEDLGTAPDGNWTAAAASTSMNYYYDQDGSSCSCYYTSGKGGTILSS